MGRARDGITGRPRSFVEAQPVLFTATVPLDEGGTVNLSPEGLTGSLAVIDEATLAYLDFAGSTAGTIAHLRENGRITLMWCAFEGPPTIVRVHGRGEPVSRDDPRWSGPPKHFPDIDPADHGLRAVVVVTAGLIRDSCGLRRPVPGLRGRPPAARFSRETDETLDACFRTKEHVGTSLDGLPAPPLPLPPPPED